MAALAAALDNEQAELNRRMVRKASEMAPATRDGEDGCSGNDL